MKGIGGCNEDNPNVAIRRTAMKAEFQKENLTFRPNEPEAWTT